MNKSVNVNRFFFLKSWHANLKKVINKFFNIVAKNLVTTYLFSLQYIFNGTSEAYEIIAVF